MASTIDRTIPVSGTDVDAPEIQSNFNAAANDVEALQATAPTADQKAALDNAPTTPNAGNPYVTLADAGQGNIPESAFTAQADVLVGTGPGAYMAQPSSPDGYLLGYDSGTATGVKGIDPATVGATVHNDLTQRDANDAHPVSAVTGLQAALDAKMTTTVYDSGADGVVDASESVAVVAVNDQGLGTLNVGELIQLNSVGQIIARANASTKLWADAVVSETIGNGTSGRVVSMGIVGGVDTSGFADRDVVYCGDAGAISTTPVKDAGGASQQIGTVLAVGVSGTLWADHSDPQVEDADGALGVLALRDTQAPFTHTQLLGVGWEEVIPGAGDTILVSAVNVAHGSNAGRLALDFSGSTNAPGDGTISGDLIIHLTVKPTSIAQELEITCGLNGAIITQEVRGGIGIGGNQSVGTIVPVTISLPVTGRSDGDEFSIFARGSTGAYTIPALSVQFLTQGTGTTGSGGGGVTVHNDLTGRSATGAHPATAVSVAPAGGISSANVQLAVEELDTEKADKTVGVTNGNLASLVGNNLADSAVPGTVVARTDQATTFTGGTVTINGQTLVLDGPAASAAIWNTAGATRVWAIYQTGTGLLQFQPVDSGTPQSTAISIHAANGGVSFGTPTYQPLVEGEVVAGADVVTEGTFFERISGFNRAVLSAYRSDTIADGVGYAGTFIVLDTTGGATVSPSPLTGQHYRLTGNGATTISAMAAAGETLMVVKATVGTMDITAYTEINSRGTGDALLFLVYDGVDQFATWAAVTP